jgi:hypothetical protein
MDDPTKALELLRRWLLDGIDDEYNDGDPETMRLVYETKIFLGVPSEVEEAKKGLRELARLDGA